MVEHRLAKARVGSSNLLSRSSFDGVEKYRLAKARVGSWCASPVDLLSRSSFDI
ncbi:hypothetical protein KUC_0054 [Vreelandella boliviensis LC1]|uniref:Uncharacterized protein n=1 Tax=Vreelandella boliviensis LC1 TaxID=1072583 RepID=A0A7U9C1G4_9GAMM|nr:hypothetical protein KUC_0054 [Halomonas boliviensis LC1]